MLTGKSLRDESKVLEVNGGVEGRLGTAVSESFPVNVQRCKPCCMRTTFPQLQHMKWDLLSKL